MPSTIVSGRAPPDELRGEQQEELVDQPLGEQRAVERRPSLAEDRAHPEARAKLTESPSIVRRSSFPPAARR